MAMPETPPWKAAGVSEEERRAQMEKMRTLTPAERQAYHQDMWQKMRERAKERGMDLPEAPAWSMSDTPWISQQERDRYQAILDQLTPQQREAARALYGAPQPPCPMATPGWGGQGPTDAPFQPPFGGGPGSQGPAMPPQGMPQGNWFAPGPLQQPTGPGMPQPSPMGQGGPWGYGPGMNPQGQMPPGAGGLPGSAPGMGGPQGFGPGFPGPQAYGPGFGAPQGYGPGYGGSQEMPPPPSSAGRLPGVMPQ